MKKKRFKPKRYFRRKSFFYKNIRLFNKININKYKKNFYGLIIIGIIILMSALILNNIENKIMPMVLEKATYEISNDLNKLINDAVNESMNKNSFNTDDFYYKTIDNNGMVNAIDINTVALNTLIGEVELYLTNELSTIPPQKIEVPIGIIFGVDFLSNIGPYFTVTVLPVGDVSVSYESSFTSVGINQINLQIWLTVDVAIKIVNPLQTEEIVVHKDFPIVNTIFSGQIPNSYLDTSQK